ncbi:MAG: pitrilysin family protein [Bdellovibrionota bacterium]
MILRFFQILFLAVSLSTCTFIGTDLLKELPKPVVFDPPKPESWTMQNGLKVFFLEDKELPLVSGSLYMKGGSLWAQPQAGIQVSAMGSLMRGGGAGKFSADELDKKLEELSASISSSFSDEYGAVSFFSLESDFDEVFGLFADVVLRPRFEESRTSLLKGQSLESILRRKDDASTVAGIAFRELLYGRDNQYGYVSIQEDVKAIDKSDLLKWHKTFVRPKDAILAVTGSIKKEVLKSALMKSFSNWESGVEEYKVPPPINFQPKPAIYFIKAPFTQATAYMGHRGVKRLSPDFMEIEVFNDIFGGGGFSSRLMKAIRTKRGLAYGVYGVIQPGVVEGQNIIVVKTKAETTGEAIDGSLDELKYMQTEPVSRTELENTRRSIENSFVFRFESPAEIIERSALLDLLDYPLDYDEVYIDKLHAVTPEDVLQVAKGRWDINKILIVIVGNDQALENVRQTQSLPGSNLADLEIVEVDFNERLISDAVH